MISGILEAKCKECNCRFVWHMDNPFPFIDAAIIGTCDNCFGKTSHSCINEFDESEKGGFEIVGKKEFEKK